MSLEYRAISDFFQLPYSQLFSFIVLKEKRKRRYILGKVYLFDIPVMINIKTINWETVKFHKIMESTRRSEIRQAYWHKLSVWRAQMCNQSNHWMDN